MFRLLIVLVWVLCYLIFTCVLVLFVDLLIGL